MNLRLRQSCSLFARQPYSLLTRLLFLAAIFAAVQFVALQPTDAAPQSQQNAGASLATLQSQAEQGDAVAQYNLALSYLRHDPSFRDPAAHNATNADDYQPALRWLLASAAQGNAHAEYLLGYMYEHGKGVPRDYAKAAENYRAAALQGHSASENNLASLYQHGQGVPRDMGKALEWYLASSRHGNPVSQCNLASLYYLGSDVPRDFKEGAKWFRVAADSGSADAQNNLGVSYYKGLGVPLDYTEAARWVRLAAEQGLPLAQTNLAYLYEQGKGVPLDYVAAYTWYSRALAAGDASGAGRRSQLARLMTRKQIDEAASLLASFSPQSQPQPSSPAASTFSLLQPY